MEAKPFSLQSPEKVAETYGGNKQKIAQAIQMGVIDPTSGLLAGMFIDRMRSAQVQEQAPKQTVAQQVFNPQPPPSPAGLGAIAPQGGGMPASAPQPPMGQPPVGMAAGGMAELPMSVNGGLTTLSLPDDMYDEQSFAGGGIVAFASAGEVDTKAERLKALMASVQNPAYSSAERRAMMEEINRLRGTVRQERMPSTLRGKSFADIDAASRAANEASGQVPFFMGLSGQVNPDILNYVAPQDIKNSAIRGALMAEPANAPVVARTPTPLLMPPGQGVLAPASTPTTALAPPPASPRPRAPAAGLASIPVPTPRPDMPTDETVAAPAPKVDPQEDLFKSYMEAYKLPEFQKVSAEERAAQKNEDLWSTLAQIGFGAAAGESPNALTNIGKATAAAIPGMQETLKERRRDTKEERQREFDYLLSAANVRGKAFSDSRSEFRDMTKLQQERALAEMRIAADAEQGRLNRENARQIVGMQMDQVPASIKEFDAYRRYSPEVQQLYREFKPSYNPMTGLSPQADVIQAQLATLKLDRLRAVQKGDKAEEARLNGLISAAQNRLLGLGAPTGGGYGAPPPGAVRPKS